MITILSPTELLKEYKKIADDLLPEPDYPKVVPEEEITRELKLLKGTLHQQRFIFVINLHKMTIENCCEIKRWLGYSDQSFTLFDYLKIIHPSHRLFHQITSKIGVSSLMKGIFPVEFMQHRLVTFIALQHKNGNYFLFKRIGNVWQYFKNTQGDHCLLEYINEFTLIKEFDETPATLTTFDENTVEQQWRDMMLAEIRKKFEENNSFSLQQYRILRDYAYNPTRQVADIALKLGIESSSISTYHKRILSNAERLFSKKFETVKQVANYMLQQGFV